MSVIAIIPARYAATRLPGKPLLADTGKTLIQHVVEAVQTASRIDRIVVATDHLGVAGTVVDFGGQAVMTGEDCASGTDRLAQAAAAIGLADDDIVINVQGDEPDMPGACIDRLVELMQTTDAPMATLATPLPALEAIDPNKVKVVLAANGRAMYFSRAPIPFDRDGEGATGHMLHLGIYGYRVGFLKTFAALEPTPAERAEKLEQLRALEHGHAIAVAVVDYAGGGIDTPEDYAAFVARQN